MTPEDFKTLSPADITALLSGRAGRGAYPQFLDNFAASEDYFAVVTTDPQFAEKDATSVINSLRLSIAKDKENGNKYAGLDLTVVKRKGLDSDSPDKVHVVIISKSRLAEATAA